MKQFLIFIKKLPKIGSFYNMISSMLTQFFIYSSSSPIIFIIDHTSRSSYFSKFFAIEKLSLSNISAE
jgi:hypothetical protein